MKIYNAPLMNEAKTALNKAINELQRPSEDVVPFTVCSNASNASRYMLYDYLDRNKISYSNKTGIRELIALCKNHNPEFNMFDTYAFECQAVSNNSANYCLDINRASKCLELAVDLKNFLEAK